MKKFRLQIVYTALAIVVSLATMGLLIWPWDVQTKAMAKEEHKEIRTEINTKIKKQDAILGRLDNRIWQILQAVKTQ